MKKFFFFRSATDKQVCVDNNPSNSGPSNQQQTKDAHSAGSLRSSLFKPQKPSSENQSLEANFGLRRCRSFSSAAFLSNATSHRSLSGLSDQSSSPSSSSSSVNAQQRNRSSRCRTLTPERHVKANRFVGGSVQSDYEGQKPLSSRSHRAHHDRRGNASLSSSNVSNEVLDLYIDGEQHHGRGSTTSKPTTGNGGGGGKRPPRIHCTAPASPSRSIKDKSRPHSSRGARGSELYPSSRDWDEVGYGHESPRELAKHVVEKLCQTEINPRTNLKDYDDVPITIEDVYGGSLNGNATFKSDSSYNKYFASERVHTSSHGYEAEDYDYSEDKNDSIFLADAEDQLDLELRCKFKEAKERVLFLSEELEQGSFLQDIDLNMPALIQRIKDLTEEKISLALEVSGGLESQLYDRTSMREQLRSAKLELEARTQRLQKENYEIQSTMEKELDRRSSDWSLKVEKFQAEELRLRERVRELAEQNVSLQREVSCLREMETERMNMERRVKDLTSMLESARGENQDLRQSLFEFQEKYKVADEDRVYIQRTCAEKEEECKELHACVTRLLRAFNEQEKTIDGLRGELAESFQRKHPMDNFDRHVQKLQSEQIRLTGVEQALRRDAESYRNEIDTLRRENINLLNRLKAFGHEGGSLTFQLDEELRSHVHILQKQGLSFLNESISLCSNLLESLKRVGRSVGKKDGIEVDGSCLDAQFIIDSDVKVQGFRRGAQSLTRSLQNISIVLHEKSDLVASISQAQTVDNNAGCLYDGLNSQELTRSELKAETLLTSLFRDKLYAKNLEVEQLQAEVATAARGNDILRCEVQNALDSLSAVSHKMKDLELQMFKKEEKINQLQSDLQESTKELTIMRGVLPKVTEERDIMWEEVKHHTEKNMLLNSEVNMLKRKVDALDEDILLKEGQITILKDSLGSKSFDLLASPERTHEFLLE